MTTDYSEKMREIIGNIRHSGGMLSEMMEPEFVSCDAESRVTVNRYNRFKWEENGRGEVHGGVVSAMLDTSMGITAVSFIQQNVATADMSVSFIRPFSGRQFLVTSEVIHIGRRLIRLNARATDEETGKLLATGTSSFMPLAQEREPGVLNA